MKKFIIICVAFAALITSTAFAVSNQDFLAQLADFKVVVNGVDRSFEKPVVTINDSTYISLREVSETLGMDVDWDARTQTITINNPDVLYPFETADGLWGYKDNGGNIVVEPKYFWGDEFREGLALVSNSSSQNGEYGFIDASGKVVIPCIYPRAYAFRNGAALVSLATGTDEGRFTYIDKQGNKLFEKEFGIARSFSEGYAVALKEGPNYASIDADKRRWSYIDKNGEFVTDMIFEEAYAFEDGYAVVKNNEKWGVIDKNFKLVLGYEYDEITNLGDGSFELKKGNEAVVRNLSLVKAEETETPDNFTDKINALMPDKENYMFSPLSIQMALALAANGAEGETKSEILKAAHIDDLDAFNTEAKAKIERYSKAEILKLDVANSIWINTSKTNSRFSDSYKTRLAEYYAAEAGMVDDTTAVDTVNGWVSEKTNEKIPTIIDDSDFWAMLINAVYFKGGWANEFSEYATSKDTFCNSDSTLTKTDFMNKTAWYNYCESGSARMIELPYKNFAEKISEDGMFIGNESYDDLDISMYVILSDEEVNPYNLVRSAVEEDRFESTFVDLSMPKFEFDYFTELGDIMNQLGMSKAFTADAEFAPMFDSGNMRISDIIHKTYIDVNEKNTEAAAVTAILMPGTGAPPKVPEPIKFKASRPFTFVIYNHADDTVLFVGQYAQAK